MSFIDRLLFNLSDLPGYVRYVPSHEAFKPFAKKVNFSLQLVFG